MPAGKFHEDPVGCWLDMLYLWLTIATAVPVGQGVGIGSCKSTARRKGEGEGQGEVVQRLGYMTFTHEIRVRFPAGEPCLERLGSQLAYASGILSRLDIDS